MLKNRIFSHLNELNKYVAKINIKMKEERTSSSLKNCSDFNQSMTLQSIISICIYAYFRVSQTDRQSELKLSVNFSHQLEYFQMLTLSQCIAQYGLRFKSFPKLLQSKYTIFYTNISQLYYSYRMNEF